MVGKLSLLLLIKHKSDRMMRGIFTLIFCFAVSYVMGQTLDDYRTIASGNWNPTPVSAVWQRYNGTSWVPATTAPVTAANVSAITITAGHTITMNVNSTNDGTITIDGSVIVPSSRLWQIPNSAGTLTINGSLQVDGALVRNNGPANIIVNGLITNVGTISNTQPARFTVNATGIYNHAASTGAIPSITWNATSTCQITGVVFVAPGGLNQSFGNVEWNTPSLGTDVDLGGALQTVRGNFTITETNGSNLILSGGSSYTLNVGTGSTGNLSVASGARVVFSDSPDVSINVRGNLETSSAELIGSTGAGGNVDLDINGSLLINSGVFDVSQGAGQTSITLAGDYTKAGTLRSTGGTALNFTFDGAGIQNFTSSTAHTFPINFSSSNTSNLTIAPTSYLSGTGSLNLASGTTLTVTNTGTNGAIRNLTNVGNVRVPVGARTYNGTVVYGGSARQFMYGDTPDVATRIDNAANVDLRQDVTFTTGTLTLETGLLRLTNSHTLTVANLAYGNASAAFGYNNGSSLVLNGTGNINLRLTRIGGNGMSNLTINRAGTVTQTTASLRINGTLALSNGTLAIGNNTLQLYGPLTAAGGGALSATASGRVYVRGSGALPASVPLSGALAILEVNRASQTFTTTGALNITRLNLYGGNVAATAGAQMASGGTIYRTNGALTAAIGAATVYNVQYLNFTAPSITTGFEIPDSPSTALNAVTINNSSNTAGIVAMTKPIVAASTIRVQRGHLHTNNFNITTGGVFRVDATALMTPGKTVFTFNGSGDQSYNTVARTPYTPYRVMSIVVNKSAGGFTLTTPVHIRNSFEVNSITTVAAGSNRLTLLSDADTTAYIPTMPGTAADNRGRINGSVIVQRYLPNENSTRQYRYLSAPTTNTMVSDWQNEIPISGTFSNPSTGTFDGVVIKSANPSMFYYNNATAAYVAYPSSGSSTAAGITNGLGYAVFGRTHTVTPLVLDSHGTLGQWDRNVTVNYTASQGVNATFNLVGNPYPAPVDWNLVHPASLRIGSTIYLTDNNNNGEANASMISYSAGAGVSVPASTFNGVIAMGQGFWVSANATVQNKQVRFRENQKVSGQAQFIRRGEPENLLRLAMKSGSVTDHLAILLMDSATSAYDEKYDGLKFEEGRLDIATLSANNDRLVINAIGRNGCDNAVPLDFKKAVTGSYTFNFTGLESFDADITPTLYDKEENKSIDLTTTSTYTFTVANVAALKGRFEIRFGGLALDTQLQVKGETTCVGNSKAFITLPSSQPGVEYTATLNGLPLSSPVIGNGGEIQIPVTVDALPQGATEVSISAQRAMCGAETLAQKATITMLRKPSIGSVTAGQVCGTGSTSLVAAAVDGSLYNWYEAIDDATPIEGQHGASFTTPSLNKTKTYFVAAVNEAGCEGERVAVKANVLEVTPAAITADGYVLTSNYASGNQWYLDGTAIEGATGKTLEAVTSGVYTVVVNTGTCSTTSEARELSILGTERIDSGISVWPNPAPEKVHVEVSSKKDVAVELISVTGVQLRSAQLSGSEDLKTATFDITSLPDGMYLVRIKTGAKTFTKKILKSK